MTTTEMGDVGSGRDDEFTLIYKKPEILKDKSYETTCLSASRILYSE